MQKEIIESKQVVTTDLVEVTKPELPDKWDYDESVGKMKGWIFRWNKLTGNILMELWVAREILSMSPEDSAKLMHGTIVPRKTWQDYCEETGVVKRTANRWLKRWTTPEQIETPPIPVGENYSIIYADPPWKYDFSETTSREIEQHYPTMELKELKELDIPCDGNSVLFMWATAPKLREALELMDTWNFDYKTHLIWDKEKIGMGYWFRGQHELLMVGVKGDFSPPKEKDRIPSIIHIPRTEHSKKPDEIRELIGKWYPKHKKIELFAREKLDGWDSWGNEV